MFVIVDATNETFTLGCLSAFIDQRSFGSFECVDSNPERLARGRRRPLESFAKLITQNAPRVRGRVGQTWATKLR